eukprot:TRINITY_DN3329_c0_g1_i3.p1 TRINITY_DN3329_c0_g1~~TRINITY_DN3329_c0_g1_i3.p1  ORF type:complete len:402 (-),score=125.40 TRINITY_DN3329_c0_g1_i3:84-1289(-)
MKMKKKSNLKFGQMKCLELIWERRRKNGFPLFLGFQVKLVMDAEDQQRGLAPEWTAHLLAEDKKVYKTPLVTGFADGFPFLLTTEPSLVWLKDNLINSEAEKNGKGQKVGMERFRPNIVVTVVTQRKHPKLCFIQPLISPQDGILTLTAPGMPNLVVDQPAANENEKKIKFKVWSDEVFGIDMGEEAEKWLSSFLGFQVKLVMDAEDQQRGLAPEWTEHLLAEDKKVYKTPLVTGFADGFPFLLTTEPSLVWLKDNLINSEAEKNGKGQKVGMERFRPNIVVTGVQDLLAPFEEDDWKVLEIKRSEQQLDMDKQETLLRLHNVKPCSRCSFPTINQETAERDPHYEPTLTLKKKRAKELVKGKEEQPCFGVNLVHQFIFSEDGKQFKTNQIHVGDIILASQ